MTNFQDINKNNLHHKDAKISFDVDNHHYYVDETKITFSVSELISNYFPKFDTDHWSKVKQNAIDNGNLLATAFFRVADAGLIEDESTPTHAFVLVYKNFEQLVNSINIWSTAEEVLGMDPSYVSTDEISKVMMIQRYKLIDEILPLREFKYAGNVLTNVLPSPVFISLIFP